MELFHGSVGRIFFYRERDNYNTSNKVHEYSLEEAKFRHELKHSKRSLSMNIYTFAFAFLLS